MSATLALTEQQRQAATETYHDLENMVYDLAWEFHRKFGGDIDDLIADANTHFMRAYTAPSFDPNKSQFITWCQNVVWRGLLADHAYPLQRKVRVSADDNMDLRPSARRNSNRLVEIAEELSEDAAIVMHLVLDMPDDLYDVAEARGGQPRNIRAALRDYLSGLGWAADRIGESFEEIKLALR